MSNLFLTASIRAIAEAEKISTEEFPISDEVAQDVSADLEYRMREIIQEAKKFTRHGKRRQMTTDDVNNALKVRNMEPIYGYPSGQNIKSVESLFKRAANSDVFYVQKNVQDFKSALRSPLPAIPPEISFMNHWLAIEGVQPSISQNPQTVIQSTHSEATNDNGEPAAKKGKAADMVEVKPLREHTLSREQQFLFKAMTEGFMQKHDEVSRQSTLKTLREDPGLHPLVPFFARYIVEEIQENKENLSVLMNVLEIFSALLKNPHVYVETYLTPIIPMVMTCVVGRRLGPHGNNEHWDVRKRAGEVVVEMCNKYSSTYHDLQRRVLKTFYDALLDKKKSISTHYGSFLAISLFGAQTADEMLIDIIPEYISIFNGKKKKRQEAAMMIDLIKGTVAIAYKYKQSLYNDAIPTSEEEKYKTANDTLENEDSSNSTTS
eukprot:m.31785 g.31785  ORF g.31785 m.31785 type:complete len:434 (-) comp9733_c0_seq3:77-1378(-)